MNNYSQYYDEPEDLFKAMNKDRLRDLKDESRGNPILISFLIKAKQIGWTKADIIQAIGDASKEHNAAIGRGLTMIDLILDDRRTDGEEIPDTLIRLGRETSIQLISDNVDW